MRVTFDAGRLLRVLLGLVCLVLLTSVGGAGIYAAPVTLPLLWLAGRYAKPFGRAVLDVVAVLTAGELGWALAYATVGEHSALIWAAPVALMVAIGVGFPLSQRAAARRSARGLVAGTA